MTEKLKLCHCGTNPRRVPNNDHVYCPECGLGGPTESWNHRPIEGELVEALEMAMSEIDQMKPTEALVAVSLIGRAALKKAKGQS